MSLVANTGKLAGRTLFVTGASRGIGKAIALKAAKDGANVVVAAKTAEPHPKLPGTIYTAAEEIEALGGKALPVIVDVRDEKQIQKAVDEAVKKFNGIDILVNNASAISLTDTAHTDMKRYDLMHNINTRGTFLAFAVHVAYTMAKYGMSMCVLGMSEEFKPFNIGVNALWPKTAIATAAIEMLTGDISASRKPEIVSDAAYVMLCKDPKSFTGNFAIDEDILQQAGVTDLLPYACDPKNADNLLMDGFLDDIKSMSDHRKLTSTLARGYHTSAANYKEAESAPPAGDGQIPQLFASIGKILSADLVNKTQAIYQFNVKGKEEGIWHLDLKNGDGACGQGEPKNPPDATLTMDSKNFTDMFAGKLKPATAFMMGKLKISGDLQKAMKLEKMMKSLKNKV
ncbi:unnamed protein product [Diatraea saccharalis]|uniref:Hydroxysteroid dehydrogenase-like protein 2 n=1 Tax=Diatraea saccharalis TaxID=40085 RepID=A0A9N9QYQ5_9NEOP|nr:unnamed protein product [Diatraea saccharalis]